MAFDGILGFLERWNHRRPLGQHPPGDVSLLPANNMFGVYIQNVVVTSRQVV